MGTVVTCQTMDALSKLTRLIGIIDKQASTPRLVNRVVILYAMQQEAQPLIDRLALAPNDALSALVQPFTVFSNSDSSILLSVNGRCPRFGCDRVGTQWASMCALSMLKQFSPDLVLNLGTCGGVRPELAFGESDEKWPPINDFGDVFIGKCALYSDRRVPIAPWQPWDIGRYALAAHKFFAATLGLRGVTIATSNAFDFTERDAEIYRKHCVVCKEMECAAIAEVCALFDTKLIALKGVTDLVRRNDEAKTKEQAQQFMSNLRQTVENVTDTAEQVINAVMGKELSLF